MVRQTGIAAIPWLLPQLTYVRPAPVLRELLRVPGRLFQPEYLPGREVSVARFYDCRDLVDPGLHRAIVC